MAMGFFFPFFYFLKVSWVCGSLSDHQQHHWTINPIRISQETMIRKQMCEFITLTKRRKRREGGLHETNTHTAVDKYCKWWCNAKEERRKDALFELTFASSW